MQLGSYNKHPFGAFGATLEAQLCAKEKQRPPFEQETASLDAQQDMETPFYQTPHYCERHLFSYLFAMEFRPAKCKMGRTDSTSKKQKLAITILQAINLFVEQSAVKHHGLLMSIQSNCKEMLLQYTLCRIPLSSLTI